MMSACNSCRVALAHHVFRIARTRDEECLDFRAHYAHIPASAHLDGGFAVDSRKIAVVAVLCAVVALVACRREEYVPMKLGGPAAEQPVR